MNVVSIWVDSVIFVNLLGVLFLDVCMNAVRKINDKFFCVRFIRKKIVRFKSVMFVIIGIIILIFGFILFFFFEVKESYLIVGGKIIFVFVFLIVIVSIYYMLKIVDDVVKRWKKGEKKKSIKIFVNREICKKVWEKLKSKRFYRKIW